MSKNDYIRIRCTSSEKEFAKKRAEIEGVTLTELVLNLLLEERKYYNESQKNNEK